VHVEQLVFEARRKCPGYTFNLDWSFPPTPSQSCPNQYRATIQRTIHARDGSLAVVTTDGYVVVSVVVPGIGPPDRLDNGMSNPGKPICVAPLCSKKERWDRTAAGTAQLQGTRVSVQQTERWLRPKGG
jgi:hypothetical protein